MSCKTQTLFFALLFAACPVYTAEPPPITVYDPNDPPEGLFSDEWMVIRGGGQKIGYAHMMLRRDGDWIYTEMGSFMKIARGVVPLSVRTVEKTVETVDGRALEFSNLMEMSGQPVRSEGVIANGEVTITTSSAGYEDTQTYAYQAGALMTWGLARESHLRGFEPGTQYTLLVYSPSVTPRSALPATVEIFGEETIDYLGSQRQAIRSVTTLKAGGASLVTTAWADALGRVLISRIDMMGMPIEMVAVDEATALADFVPKEMFNSLLVPVGRAIPTGADRVVYKVKLKSGSNPQLNIPESAIQKVAYDANAGVAMVTVLRPGTQLMRAERDAMGDELKTEATSANMLINSEAANVQALLEEVNIPKGASASQKAKLLNEFVYDYIDEKSLDIGFASASETVDSASGDCSEHGVLLAALGRAAGISSRVAAGLLYMPRYAGQDDVMGYHMWTQFYIDGRWVDYDPTRPERFAAPTRIALVYSTLSDDSLAAIGLEMVDATGNLEVTVVDVE